MVKEQYESLKAGKSLRKDLIALKQELKGEEARKELLELLQGDYSLLTGLITQMIVPTTSVTPIIITVLPIFASSPTFWIRKL